MDYFKNRKNIFFLREKQRVHYGITERLVKCIWFDREIKRNVKTLDGKITKVISPGQWNLCEGPDFLNAKIKIGNKILNGDVEIHRYSSDWKAHSHYKNLRFKNVILHAFMWQKGKNKWVLNSENKKISQVELFPLLKKNLKKVV